MFSSDLLSPLPATILFWQILKINKNLNAISFKISKVTHRVRSKPNKDSWIFPIVIFFPLCVALLHKACRNNCLYVSNLLGGSEVISSMEKTHTYTHTLHFQVVVNWLRMFMGSISSIFKRLAWNSSKWFTFPHV